MEHCNLDVYDLYEIASSLDPIQAKNLDLELNLSKFLEVMKPFFVNPNDCNVSNQDLKKELFQYLDFINETSRINFHSVYDLINLSKKERMDAYIATDPRKFWNQQKKIFPILAPAVLNLYDVCVSSAETERQNSITKRLLKPQRSSMEPKLIQQIRFIQQNFPYFYPEFFRD